jgi:SAM-dependent methyltransferase
VTRSFYDEGLSAIHEADYGDVALGGAKITLQRLRSAGVERGCIVELGCGPGLSARAFVDAGFSVLACDIAQPMIDRARRLVPEATFSCVDLQSFAWPETAVAVVAFGEVLSYARNASVFDQRLEEVFDAAARVLNAGGVFIFDLVTPGRAGPSRTSHLHHDRAAYELVVEGVEDPELRTLDRWIHGTLRTPVSLHIDEHHRQITADVELVRTLLEQRGFSVQTSDSYEPGGPRRPGWEIFCASKDRQRGENG